MFEPMRGAVAMLKRFGILMSEQSIEALERAPFEWEDTKKLVAAARERLGPLQINQAERIKAESAMFTIRVTEFIVEFKKEAWTTPYLPRIPPKLATPTPTPALPPPLFQAS